MESLPELTKEDKKRVRSALANAKYTGIASRSNLLSDLFGKENLPVVLALYKEAGSAPKFFQQWELVTAHGLLNKMLDEYNKSGNLHNSFHHVQKNLIALSDKMRKQDEGTKSFSEVRHFHDDLRKVIDMQLKQVEGKEVVESV